ncbi:hypothetical protein R6Y95_08585 [Methanoculleus palmolei]|uniref:Uncharacterized protein n=1 Tax=Methanoculleus palmolei TaxID=72612 RepID=A0ABD8A8S0_9EURY|nr:hypothetical protein R6Y95_08585 [Methanoculleus palmolei]
MIQNLLYPLRDVPVRQSPKRVYAVLADVSLPLRGRNRVHITRESSKGVAPKHLCRGDTHSKLFEFLSLLPFGQSFLEDF